MSVAPRIAAILGAGKIGAGWAARLALMGWEVRVFDPDDVASARIEAALARARASLPALYDVALPPEGTVARAATIPDAVTGSHWILDCAPDGLDLKHNLFQLVEAHCSDDALISSSSVGLMAAEMQDCATRPGQILRLRPVDPVYLIPQVQLEGSDGNDPACLTRTVDCLTSVGMAPGDTDAGAALTAVAMKGASDLFQRDATLVALLRGLKPRCAPLVAPLLAHEVALAPPMPKPDATAPPVTLDRQVPITWVDYNGHMNEARYVTAFSAAADRLLLWAGMDAACIAAGHSVFTVETHVRYLAEVQIGDRIRVTTRVLQGGGRKFHIWHELFVGNRLSATGEQLLLHVDLATRRSALPPPAMSAWLARAAAAHAALPPPEGLGRHVGQRA